MTALDGSLVSSCPSDSTDSRGRRAARAHRWLGGRRRDAVSPDIAGPGQLAGLVADLRGPAPGDWPLLVSIDQEGGLVQRLRAPATEWPPMLAVGSAGDAGRTTAVGRALGEELAAVGVGWNFAPVLDVHTNPANPVIGNRAFGTTPETVARQALAFWRGLRAAGLVGCGKHYPGHGDTRTDSHHELPVVAHDIDRLRAVELALFVAAAAAGVEAFMTAHVLYPALDPDRPATLSRRIATDLLRGEIGFRGVLVFDDLGMKAVADRYPIEELAVGAIEAGCDHLLVREPARASTRRSRRSSTPPRRAATCAPASRRAPRACARSRPPAPWPFRARRDVALAAGNARPQGPGRLIRGRGPGAVAKFPVAD